VSFDSTTTSGCQLIRRVSYLECNAMLKSTPRIDRRRFLEITTGATAALLNACEVEVESPRHETGAGGSSGSTTTAGSGSSTVATSGAGGTAPDGSPTGTGGSGGSTPDGSSPTDGGVRDARDGSAQDATDAREAGPPPPLTEADWQALTSSLSGTVIRPGNALYNQARVVFNTRFDSIMPQAVVRAANPSDVSKVLAFVQKFGLAVTPRCGGHDFAG